jgi:hypothetical protein
VRSLGENACRRFFFFWLLAFPSSRPPVVYPCTAGMLDVLNNEPAAHSLPVESSLKRERKLFNFLGIPFCRSRIVL